MADEITVSVTLACTNGDFSFSRRINSVSVDQTAVGSNGGVQSIGFAAHEAVAIGDLGTEGYGIFRNLDNTNFVDLGIDVAAAWKPIMRLKAGEACLFRLSTDVLYAKADTAAVNLEYTILED